MTEVSAGIITDPDGRILACQRGEGRHNALLWEFPGGKRETGEDAAACLRRELMEELRLPVSAPKIVAVREAEGIRFTFLTAETTGAPVLTEHADAGFFAPRELLRLHFCPADRGIAAALALNAPPLRHFLWDYDGTVMDTYPAYSRALAHAAGGCGISITETTALDLLKDSLPHAVERLSQAHGVSTDTLWTALQAENDALAKSEPQPVRGIPEALARLTALGGRHYLVTHHDLSCMADLRRTGLLSYFSGFATAEDNLPRKPAPDLVLKVLTDHAIDPAQAVMIGDRPLDTAAGRAAGILSCLLDEEGRFPQDACELRCRTAAELPGLLCPEAL